MSDATHRPYPMSEDELTPHRPLAASSRPRVVASDPSSLSRRSSFHHAPTRSDSSHASHISVTPHRLASPAPHRLASPAPHRLASPAPTPASAAAPSAASAAASDHHTSRLSRRPSRHLSHASWPSPLPLPRPRPRHPQCDDSGDTDKRSASLARHQSYHSGVEPRRSSRPRRLNSNLHDEKTIQLCYSANEQRIKHLEKIVHDLSREINAPTASSNARLRSSRRRPPAANLPNAPELSRRSKPPS